MVMPKWYQREGEYGLKPKPKPKPNTNTKTNEH